MKKLIYLFLGLVLVTSCERENRDWDNNKCIVVSEFTDKIQMGNDVTYSKITVEGHDYYYRYWYTGSDHSYGSEMIHCPNCRTCNK